MNRKEAIVIITSQLASLDDEEVQTVADMVTSMATEALDATDGILPRELTARELALIEQSKEDFRLGRTYSADEYRAEIDTDILTRYRLHSVLLSFNPDVFPLTKTNLVYVEQQLLEVFLYGLATPKGEKLIQKYKHQRTKK